MKFILSFLIIMLITPTVGMAMETKQTAYDFSFQTLEDQKEFPLRDQKGKVLLIVNTASKCGFTKQYDALEKLHQTYKDKGLVVIGVPSGDFGGQEFSNDSEIATFCRTNYGVTFPMMSKEKVIGEAAHPFYAWAKKELGFGSSPKWNFHKYLVGRDGELIDYFGSMTAPDTPKMIKAIESALQK